MSPQLDPDTQTLLEVMRAAGTPQPYTLSVEDARESMRAALIARGEPLPLHSVENLSLSSPHGTLPMRLYRPAEGPLPTALFLHGGGWTLNDLDTHDRLCRRIARRSGWLVAALDYRRAPEHQHPAALEDAHLAYRWLRDNAERIAGSRSALALVGESSGGTTAACLSLLLRDLGAPMPRVQVLAYPLTDLGEDWASYRQCGSGYVLDAELVRWYAGQYVPKGHDTEDPYLFPLSTQDLAGLCPTVLITAEFDPLRDGGLAYLERLRIAGVPVEHIHAEDQIHGFLLLDRVVSRAAELIDRMADALASCAEPMGDRDRALSAG